VELANLADAAARGGAVPVVLEALTARNDERQQIATQLANVERSPRPSSFASADVRKRLRGFLDDWNELLTGNPDEARGVLEATLTDRIRFTPDVDARTYELAIPVGYDRVLVAALPELRG